MHCSIDIIAWKMTPMVLYYIIVLNILQGRVQQTFYLLNID